MKNIHILPTDKPSRLYLSDYDKEINLSGHPLRNYTTGQNIYITSDEEIKEGDWFLTDDKRVEKCAPDWRAREWHKKIILTTDFRLAPDVQKIDDEFLEWFVKNPSCEFVEWSSEKIEGSFDGENWKYKYKIIIPKEEPKTFKELFANTGIEPTTDENGNVHYNFKATIKEEPTIVRLPTYYESKQETLEEAALIYASKPRRFGTRMTFIDGAKWQQERSYSEEDMMDYSNYRLLIKKALNPKEWFEQFKKK